MRNYKYRGKDCRLGRHGKVSKGDILALTELESLSVSSDKEFVLVREVLPKDFPKEEILPMNGQYYNLEYMSWKSKKVFKEVRRMRRTRLMGAIKQLEAIGFPVPRVDYRTDVEFMRDILLTTARQAGWM